VTIDAATDADVFGTFVRESLIPVLHSGDVVVWDNLSAHKSIACRAALEQKHAELIPLPPYSPDLSPIEPCWSKVKQHVRSSGARTIETLGQAAAEGFAMVTRHDALGWFNKSGYCVH